MGHKVISYGTYYKPDQPGVLRPGIPNLFFDGELRSAVMQSSKDDLHPLLIEWADVIIIMHITQWIENNWSKIKDKRVVWRSIGQSIPDIELKLEPYRRGGLQIVRYSPTEKRMRKYIGEDAVIRFYKDENEFNGYVGDKEQVMTIAQAMCNPGRERELSWGIYNKVVKDLPAKLFGLGNECAGDLWGGQLGYDEMKSELRQNRCYFYTGTKPAPYTLGFIEAMMTGIPIVAIGRGIAYDEFYEQDTYEASDLIQSGVNGFASDKIDELRDYIKELLNNQRFAKKISVEGRNTAVKLFGKAIIRHNWENFL